MTKNKTQGSQRNCCAFLDLVGTRAALEMDPARYAEMLRVYTLNVAECAEKEEIEYVGFSDSVYAGFKTVDSVVRFMRVLRMSLIRASVGRFATPMFFKGGVVYGHFHYDHSANGKMYTFSKDAIKAYAIHEKYKAIGPIVDEEIVSNLDDRRFVKVPSFIFEGAVPACFWDIAFSEEDVDILFDVKGHVYFERLVREMAISTMKHSKLIGKYMTYFTALFLSVLLYDQTHEKFDDAWKLFHTTLKDHGLTKIVTQSKEYQWMCCFIMQSIFTNVFCDKDGKIMEYQSYNATHHEIMRSIYEPSNNAKFRFFQDIPNEIVCSLAKHHLLRLLWDCPDGLAARKHDPPTTKMKVDPVPKTDKITGKR